MEVPARVPEGLLFYPCEPVGAGKTYGSLEVGYVMNTSCIGKYKKVIDGVHTYNREISEKINGVAND